MEITTYKYPHGKIGHSANDYPLNGVPSEYVQYLHLIPLQLAGVVTSWIALEDSYRHYSDSTT